MISPLAEPGAEETLAQRAANLRIILGSMAGGVLLLVAVTGIFYLTRPALPATPAALKLLQAASAVNAAFLVLLYPVSGVVFGAVLRAKTPAPAPRLQSACVLRGALREISGLVGAVACLLAVMNGAMAAQPLFWINLATPLVFALTTFLSLPTEDSLRERLSDLEVVS